MHLTMSKESKVKCERGYSEEILRVIEFVSGIVRRIHESRLDKSDKMSLHVTQKVR